MVPLMEMGRVTGSPGMWLRDRDSGVLLRGEENRIWGSPGKGWQRCPRPQGKGTDQEQEKEEGISERKEGSRGGQS